MLNSRMPVPSLPGLTGQYNEAVDTVRFAVPILLYWGEDEFTIAQAVTTLRAQVLDPAWVSFNDDRFTPEAPDAIVAALNQAMTPPFGIGKRLVWLEDSTLGQRCPEDVWTELERTLAQLPETTVLLLTMRSKPDGRLKSTKLLLKQATVKEFSLIPAWKTELLVKQVQQIAQTVGVRLTPSAVELLAEAVGNNTRQLYSELEKLQLFAGESMKPLDEAAIAALVAATTQSTFQLGTAIRQGQIAVALDLVAALLRRNEPALRIVSSLVGQFRTWVWVKLMVSTGERNDQTIAQAAEIPNPKRLFYLRQEVESLALPNLLQTLPVLLELEASLKRGADELATLQTKTIELCQLCRPQV
jgi:DNA polymerase-3 subunit delta